MTEQLLLATWSLGLEAVRSGWPKMGKGKYPLDAVIEACRYAEYDRENHTVGYSGYPDESGAVSLDASVMVSPQKSGAVAYVRKYANVAELARVVMDKTPHKLLVGEGAEDLARAEGFEMKKLLTPEMKRVHQQWQEGKIKKIRKRNIEESQCLGTHDTIGVLAINGKGNLAGACSTSGLAFKKKGRVGDSPTIGHGLYVEQGVGAAVLTGIGERVMGICGSFLAVECLRRGHTTKEASTMVLQRIRDSFPVRRDEQVGIIVLGASGEWSAKSLLPGFVVAVHGKKSCELINAQC